MPCRGIAVSTPSSTVLSPPTGTGVHPVPEPRDRRGDPKKPDTGQRRRTVDQLTLDRIAAWMEAHDDWARDWTARMESRMTTVEGRADLLDGKAGNDDGLIGKLGELRGAVGGIEKRQERQAKSLEAIRSDVKDLKNKTGAVDGQKPPGRFERIMTVVGPILVVLITTLGGVVIAYLALRGQLAGLTKGSP